MCACVCVRAKSTRTDRHTHTHIHTHTLSLSRPTSLSRPHPLSLSASQISPLLSLSLPPPPSQPLSFTQPTRPFPPSTAKLQAECCYAASQRAVSVQSRSERSSRQRAMPTRACHLLSSRCSLNRSPSAKQPSPSSLQSPNCAPNTISHNLTSCPIAFPGCPTTCGYHQPQGITA